MAADARDLPVGEVRAVLTVVGRGDLAFASLHRRPLLQHALAALEELLPGRVSVVADPADVRRTTKAAGHRSVDVAHPVRVAPGVERPTAVRCWCTTRCARWWGRDFLRAGAGRGRARTPTRPWSPSDP